MTTLTEISEQIEQLTINQQIILTRLIDGVVPTNTSLIEMQELCQFDLPESLLLQIQNLDVVSFARLKLAMDSKMFTILNNFSSKLELARQLVQEALNSKEFTELVNSEFYTSPDLRLGDALQAIDITLNAYEDMTEGVRKTWQECLSDEINRGIRS